MEIIWSKFYIIDHSNYHYIKNKLVHRYIIDHSNYHYIKKKSEWIFSCNDGAAVWAGRPIVMYNKGTPVVIQMLLHMIYSHWLMAPSRKIEHSWNRPLDQIISWSCWQQQLDGCGRGMHQEATSTIPKTRPTTSAGCAGQTKFDITLWSLQSSHVLRSLL